MIKDRQILTYIESYIEIRKGCMLSNYIELLEDVKWVCDLLLKIKLLPLL